MSQSDPSPPAVSAFLSTFTPKNSFKLSPLAWAELETDLRFVKMLGRGGMGIVVVAEQLPRGERVALKVLDPELYGHRDAFNFFVKEALHLSRLNHRNIIPVLKRSNGTGVPWFAMPYIAEGNLGRFLLAGKPMTNASVLEFGLQLSAALQFAHEKGIIHRDLKPANVLVDGNHHLYLADFGLSRSLLNDELLDPGKNFVEGTPQYQSPSALRGEHGDTRDDIYSFGALLYEMLTAHPPFPGKNRTEVLAAIESRPPAKILFLNPDADPGLALISEGAMAPELSDRYASMRYIREDLERVKMGRFPLGPHRKAKTFFLSKAWVSNFRAQTLVLSLLFLITIAFTIGQLYYQSISLPISARTSAIKLVRPFPLPEELSGVGILVGNWHGSEAKEIYVACDTILRVFSKSGESLAEWKLPPGGSNAQFGITTDVNDDGFEEAFVSWTRDTEAAISIVNPNGYEVKRFSVGNLKPAILDTHQAASLLRAKLFATINSKKYLFATLETGFELYPRQLCCFDFFTQQLVWSRDVAAFPSVVLLHDLEVTGNPVLLLGTHAVDNGAKALDGTDDSHSYLHAFSLDGRSLWTLETGGIYTQAIPLPADLDGDSVNELYAWVRRGEDFALANKTTNKLGRILQINSSGQISSEIDLGTRLSACISFTTDSGRRQELLAADWEGNLHLLGEGLSLKHSRNITRNSRHRVRIPTLIPINQASEAGAMFLLSTTQEEIFGTINTGDPLAPPNHRRFWNIELHLVDHQLRTIERLTLNRLSERTFIRELWLLDQKTFLIRKEDLVIGSFRF